jgi:arsenite-transporting ATPase
MRDLLTRCIIFVGGKGGVGKTTMAAALALIAAERGRRVLAVSTDPAHSLGDIFDKPIGDRETALIANLWGLEIDPDATADRYMASVKKNMRSLVGPAMYGEIERQMNLARLAPGAVEAALLERTSELMAEAKERYDLVIFDTAPTGHTIRLLSLPEIMAAWTDGLLKHQERSDKLGEVLGRLGGKRRGSKGDDLSYIDQEAPAGGDRNSRIREILLERRRKFHRARRLLLDGTQTAFLMVLNPEKLPILESKKALAILREFHVPVAGLIVNRVLPAEAGGEFLENRRRQESQYLAEIEREFGSLRRWYMPLLPRDVHGVETLNLIGRALFEERI